MNNNPEISICVPVYNTAPYLAAFIDSALLQSFEDYEIVLVDNCSTDNSYAILKKYAQAFPEKVFVYQTEIHGTAGKPRNLALSKAKGRYVYMCDSDDLILPNALEDLYREATRYKADLVCASALQVFEENGEIIKIVPFSTKKTGPVSNETAVISGTEFWLRLIKRDLIDKVGSIPEGLQDDMWFEDVRYLGVLHSYAKNVRHLNRTIYCWFKRGASSTSSLRKVLCADSITAAEDTMRMCNQQYLYAAQHLAADRAGMNANARWPFFDMFVEEVRGYSPWFHNNRLLKNNGYRFKQLCMLESLADIHFPNIIYVDGFAAAPTEERLAELREKVFHDGCEIVVLSPESCDVNENEYIKRAYERGDLALVTGYFALKNIYENGGVFIHNNIRILNYFSYLKFQNAFFSLIDKTTYSEWIYGAPAGNEAVGAILKTFSDTWDKKGEYMPLSERISIILTAKYGIPLDGKARLFQKVVSVISPDLSVVDTRFGDVVKKCAFEHDFSACAGEPDYVTLPRTTLRVLMTPPPPPAPAPVQKSAREIALERELADIKRGNTFKLMMKIRAIGDGPHGPFLKKIFHWMLRVRKKLLRK